MLNTFLLLPQTDDAILKIIQDENSYKQFVNEITDIIMSLPKDNSIKLFYDSNNVQTFIDICRQFEKETYLNNAANQIRSFISPKSANIKDKSTKDNNCIYVLWNYEKLPSVECNPPEIISEIAEKILLHPNEKFLLLNISENIKADRNVLLVCKDAKHIPNLPAFTRIAFITDKSDLELWLATNHITTFSLLDDSRFARTNIIEQGQRVFQEINTRYFWYLDNFHKNHYEVFNSTGKQHIGEADLYGKLDISKHDSTKKPINI